MAVRTCQYLEIYWGWEISYGSPYGNIKYVSTVRNISLC